MARNIFKGLGVALITPFTSDGNVDYKSLTRLVEYQIDNSSVYLPRQARLLACRLRKRKR